MTQGPRTRSSPTATPSCGKASALPVDDLHLDPVERAALHGLDGDLLVGREFRMLTLEYADAADGAHLGHAPAVHDRDAVGLLERLDHGGGGQPSRRP